MKATLKHVANQYILIVDKPIVGKILYSIILNQIGEKLTENQVFYIKSCNLKGIASIIAAENLEGVKGIKIEHNNHLLKSKQSRIREILDGKEVEVTEEEDYYLIRL